jgi:hypothetical protein
LHAKRNELYKKKRIKQEKRKQRQTEKDGKMKLNTDKMRKKMRE